MAGTHAPLELWRETVGAEKRGQREWYATWGKHLGMGSRPISEPSEPDAATLSKLTKRWHARSCPFQIEEQLSATVTRLEQQVRRPESAARPFGSLAARSVNYFGPALRGSMPLSHVRRPLFQPPSLRSEPASERTKHSLQPSHVGSTSHRSLGSLRSSGPAAAPGSVRSSQHGRAASGERRSERSLRGSATSAGLPSIASVSVSDGTRAAVLHERRMQLQRQLDQVDALLGRRAPSTSLSINSADWSSPEAVRAAELEAATDSGLPR